VEYDSVESAKKAFDSMKGEEVDGRHIFLDFAEERSGKNPLYISALYGRVLEPIL
jgi:hypothetical protein